MDKTAAVFVDNGYLSKVLKNQFGSAKINYELFSENICKKCSRFRTYIYDCPPYQSQFPTPEERQRAQQADKFFYSLNKLSRFEVRLGRLQKSFIGGGYQQKGVDVLLSVDLVTLSTSGKIDKAILVTADSDFVPAVRAAKEAKVLVEMYFCPAEPKSDELFQICDDRFHIDAELVKSSLMNKK